MTERERTSLTYRILLKVALAGGVLGLVATLILLPGTLMMFDAPGSTDSPLTKALFVGSLALPIVALTVLVTARRARKQEEGRDLTVPLVLLFGWLLYEVAIFGLIDRLCGGSLDCPAPMDRARQLTPPS